MPDWAQIISDALDILKFDGAVQDTLAELRGKWGAQVPALLDERFDAIGIQYMKWPILEQFTPEKVKDLISYYRVHKKPMIELANGWYHIEILGGETLQDGDYEPTFEFVIQPATNEEATINADMNFSFEITSSAY